MEQLKRFLRNTSAQAAEILNAERERLPLWLPVFIGIGVGIYYALPQEPAMWGAVLSLVIVAALLLLLMARPVARAVVLCLFVTLLGFSAAVFQAQNRDTLMLEKRAGPARISGIVAAADTLPENKGWRIVLSDVSLEKRSPEKTPEKVRLQIYKKAFDGDILPGMQISVLAIINPPPLPVMPGAFDFRRQMFFNGLGGTGYALGPVTLVQKGAERNGWALFWEKLRGNVRSNIAAAFPDRPVTASLLSALLAGEREGISDETWGYIRAAGLSHLLAISGLHIGLVAGLLFFALRAALALSEKLALYWPIKKISAVFALCGSIVYLLLVGAPVSAQRAVMMTGIVLLAVMLDRTGLTMRLAALAAAVILLLTPYALLNAGFQMSFAAVVCLIAFYEALSEKWKSWYRQASVMHRSALYFLGTILTTIIASLATAPFALFHFHRVAGLVSLLTNLLAVPLTAFLVMPAGLAALVLMPLGLHYWPLQLTGVGIEMIYELARDIGEGGKALIHAPSWSLNALLLMVAGGLWLCLWRSRVRLLGFALIAGGILLAVHTAPRLQPDIYISDRGDLTGLRLTQEMLALSSRRREKFVAGQWQRHAGLQQSPVAWPEEGDIGEALQCDWLSCRWQKDGRRIIIVRNPLAFLTVCDPDAVPPDLLIAPQDGVPWQCRADVKIDRFDLWRGGAHALFVNEGVINVKTVAEQGGIRLWSPERFVRKNDKNKKYRSGKDR